MPFVAFVFSARMGFAGFACRLCQLGLLSYALAGVPSIAPYFSIMIMVFITIVLLGMRGLAVQLSNPFGNDSVDFEIETFMRGAYTNAVAHLRSADISSDACCLPSATMRNPLAARIPAVVKKKMEQAWSKRPSQVGQIKDDDRVLTEDFIHKADVMAHAMKRGLGFGAGPLQHTSGAIITADEEAGPSLNLSDWPPPSPPLARYAADRRVIVDQQPTSMPGMINPYMAQPAAMSQYHL